MRVSQLTERQVNASGAGRRPEPIYFFVLNIDAAVWNNLEEIGPLIVEGNTSLRHTGHLALRSRLQEGEAESEVRWSILLKRLLAYISSMV